MGTESAAEYDRISVNLMKIGRYIESFLYQGILSFIQGRLSHTVFRFKKIKSLEGNYSTKLSNI